ncbi:putative reverse transcriptase domain-containing protein [Tanacetum coccineum]|uniref:Reverse transcriptase domain-containing protein n=1 Tax=Tanacetum coccineum TaxID=301880 RepID=A0ABQ4WBY9_9ASTR
MHEFRIGILEALQERTPYIRSCVVCGGMEHDFLSKKGSIGRRGVKEKNKVVIAMDVVVSLSVIDEPVVKEKQSSLVDTSIPNVEKTGLTQGSTMAGNTSGMSSYANVTGEPSRKALNFRILFTPEGNMIAVVVPVESIRTIGERFSNTAYGFFLEKRVAYPAVANYVKYGLWNPDVNLLKENVGNVPVWVKLHGVLVTAFNEDGLSALATKLGTPLMLDSYTSDICLQSWGMQSYARAILSFGLMWMKTPRCAFCKVFGHIQKECPKNPGLGVTKNLKKPSQASRGVPVGPKVRFKPAKEYKPVSKNPTANTSSNKKKCAEPTKEWLLFWNVETSSTSTTPIVDKICKLEKLIIDEKITLVDDDGKPLKKVDYLGDHDSGDEVESVDNDMTRSMASEMVGFGTKILLEQWRHSYENDDYDEDPYDDDMYECQDFPDKIQDICDNLDIRFRGRRKK